MMLFRRKQRTEPQPSSDSAHAQAAPVHLHAHKYSIQFDISPEISYLNDSLCRLLTEFLPLFERFPEGIWISKQAVDEGVDSCRINFWTFAEEPDIIKEFSIWFQAFFRDESIIDLFERFIKNSLEDPVGIEVTLVDWTRVHVIEDEVRKIVEQELHARAENTPD